MKNFKTGKGNGDEKTGKKGKKGKEKKKEKEKERKGKEAGVERGASEK